MHCFVAFLQMGLFIAAFTTGTLVYYLIQFYKESGNCININTNNHTIVNE
jgi:hypothetical protein